MIIRRRPLAHRRRSQHLILRNDHGGDELVSRCQVPPIVSIVAGRRLQIGLHGRFGFYTLFGLVDYRFVPQHLPYSL